MAWVYAGAWACGSASTEGLGPTAGDATVLPLMAMDASPPDDDVLGLGPVDWQVTVDLNEPGLLEGFIEVELPDGLCRLGARSAELTPRVDCPACSVAYTFEYSDLFVRSGPPGCQVPEAVGQLIEGERIHFGHVPGAGEEGTLVQNRQAEGNPDGRWEPYEGGVEQSSRLPRDRALDVWVYGARQDRLGLGLGLGL